MRAIDRGGEREDRAEQREKCEREQREVGSNAIYTWRFQREADVWRETLDGWRETVDGWREGGGRRAAN